MAQSLLFLVSVSLECLGGLYVIELTRGLYQVGVPYIRAKAQDYYESLGGGVDTDLIEETPAARRLRLSQQVSS